MKRGGLAPPCRGWLPNIPPIRRPASKILKDRLSCVDPPQIGDSHPANVATDVACPDPQMYSQKGRRLQGKHYLWNRAIPGVLLCMGLFHNINYFEMTLAVENLYSRKVAKHESPRLRPTIGNPVTSTLKVETCSVTQMDPPNPKSMVIKWWPNRSRTHLDPECGLERKDNFCPLHSGSAHGGTCEEFSFHRQNSLGIATSLHTPDGLAAKSGFFHHAPCGLTFRRVPPGQSRPPRGCNQSHIQKYCPGKSPGHRKQGHPLHRLPPEISRTPARSGTRSPCTP